MSRQGVATLSLICTRNPADPRCPRPREQAIPDGGGGGGGFGVTGRGTAVVTRAPVKIDEEGATIIPPGIPDTASDKKKSIQERTEREEAEDPFAGGVPEARTSPDAVRRFLELDDSREPSLITDDPSVSLARSRFGGIVDDDFSSSLSSLQYRPSGSGGLSALEFQTARSVSTAPTVPRTRGIRSLRPANEVERVARPREEIVEPPAEATTVVGEEGRMVARGLELPRKNILREQIATARRVPFGSTARDIRERNRIFGEGGYGYDYRRDPFFSFRGSTIEAQAREDQQQQERIEQMTRQLISERQRKGFTPPVEDNKGYSFLDPQEGFDPSPLTTGATSLPVRDPPPPTTTLLPTEAEGVGTMASRTGELGGLTEIGEDIGEALL